jgi:hypothetical protein
MAPFADPADDLGAVAEGAIAQLGERVVRNDEVGGSIPPGSTILRSLRELLLGNPVIAPEDAKLANEVPPEPERRRRTVNVQNQRGSVSRRLPYSRRNCSLATAPAINPRGNNLSNSGTILMPRPGITVRLLAINP